VFIIIKSGESPTQAKIHKSYPGALRDKRNPQKQIKKTFVIGWNDIIILYCTGKNK